jgi:hypothetical protein
VCRHVVGLDEGSWRQDVKIGIGCPSEDCDELFGRPFFSFKSEEALESVPSMSLLVHDTDESSRSVCVVTYELNSKQQTEYVWAEKMCSFFINRLLG